VDKMPELPEVQTVVTGLDKLLRGKKIVNTHIYDDMVIGYPVQEEFLNISQDKEIESLSRRGKYIIINFKDSEYKLIVHLRMSGKLLYKDRNDEKDKHTHVIFEFNDDTDLRFNNVRKFGRLYFITENDIEEAGNLKNLGVEPLSENFTLELFEEMLSKRKGMIKPLIMNQEFIAGIGNIYADEALYQAHIKPDRKANTLNEEEIEDLYIAIREILKKGIKMGGTSVSDYVNALGKSGQFQHQLNVYKKEGNKCAKCGAEIEKKKVSGRAARFCPECQN
jgi:formamidopyrimidine-DNA glycosylase